MKRVKIKKVLKRAEKNTIISLTINVFFNLRITNEKDQSERQLKEGREGRRQKANQIPRFRTKFNKKNWKKD